jgi:LacI family transcriptional regulator
MVLDVGNPFFTDLARGVEAAAAHAGLTVLLCNSGDDPAREDHYLAILQEQRSYGVLMTPVRAATDRIRRMRAYGTPVVFVDQGSSRRQCSVTVDDVAGGELAVGHLLAVGHRRIAFVGGPMSTRQVADRLAGAQRATLTAEAGAAELDVIETAALTVAAGREAAVTLDELPPSRRPTAAFCANDLVALGMLQELTRRQRSVPADLAIVGYDDIQFAAAAAVPLTSIAQPREQLGRAATELLIEEVEQPLTHVHQQIVFQPELVVRESTGGS